jgi:DNA-binding transcriptional regulator YiaG
MSGPGIRAIRRGLGLSQREFCERFRFGLSSLKNWEQSVKRPPKTVEILLLLIAHDPALVDRAIADCRNPPLEILA